MPVARPLLSTPLGSGAALAPNPMSESPVLKTAGGLGASHDDDPRAALIAAAAVAASQAVTAAVTSALEDTDRRVTNTLASLVEQAASEATASVRNEVAESIASLRAELRMMAASVRDLEARCIAAAADAARDAVQAMSSTRRTDSSDASGQATTLADLVSAGSPPAPAPAVLRSARSSTALVVTLAAIPVGVASLSLARGADEAAIRRVVTRRDFTAIPFLTSRVSAWQGDITTLSVDCIVNPTNRRLANGGVVDAAIHRKAGPGLLAECRALPVVLVDGEEVRCPTGDAKITGGHGLAVRHVVHTAGPVGEAPDALASCYRRSLEVATAEGCRSIAFPCISTGGYGYPIVPAAWVALTTVREFLSTRTLEQLAAIDRIIFCVFAAPDAAAYKTLLPIVFP